MMQTVYDKDGVAAVVDAVDARERIATGRWFAEPPVKRKDPDPPQKPVKRGDHR